MYVFYYSASAQLLGVYSHKAYTHILNSNREDDAAKDSSTSKKSEKRVKKPAQLEDHSESQFDGCGVEVTEGKKDRTHRKSKKRVKLELQEDHPDRQLDDCNANVLQGKRFQSCPD